MREEGDGRAVAIPKGGKLRTAEQLLEWLGSAWISSGLLFRSVSRHGKVSDDGLSAQSAAAIVKKYAVAVGLDPEQFGAHSLRASFVSTALHAGADLLVVAGVTGQRDVRTLKVYDRREKFRSHAGWKFM